MCTIHVQYNTWCQRRLGVHVNADGDYGGDTSDADDAEGDEDAPVTDDDDDICRCENADELSSTAT